VRGHLADKKLQKKYLNKQAPSQELEGLVMLCLDYISQGSGQQALHYPKSAFRVMARTSFNKMFSLMPEHAFFGKKGNMSKWADLVMTIAMRMFPSIGKNATGKFKKQKKPKVQGEIGEPAKPIMKDRKLKDTKREPVLNMVLAEMEHLPGDDEGTMYKSTVSREDWLENMNTQDKLGKSNDKRMEGMGAYGDATDAEVREVPRDLHEDDSELEVGEESDSDFDKLGSDVGEQLAPNIERGDEQKVDEKVDEKVDAKSNDKDDVKYERTGKEAPLFELRGLIDMFGIVQDIDLSDWAGKVEEVYQKVETATGSTKYEAQGKPTIAKDVDSPTSWKKL